MLRDWGRCLLFFLVLTVLTGLVYPLLVTGLAQLVFPHKANGSLIEKDGKVVGSYLIGQEFTSPYYFHGRPSASDYDAMDSGGPNYAPSSRALAEEVEKRYHALAKENPGLTRQKTPLDLITTSASGLDPHISPEAALIQVPRIAQARSVPEEALVRLVKKYTRPRWLGLFGEPRVNVLELNLALDRYFGSPTARVNRDQVQVYRP
ncbi:potassium-transporting ATPase, C subunit [Ammonifex degensii KC4]|uniref:Potassium-transporting ATPase KdpC subunit n=1 Tax=Ammonifex degensii (strain DSM 10501 / KC4) TaxID=429009 RepID=C9R8E8_AMMDK|nr:potassium-transporting ATPase subunit KdpC [Ammonifex degensii]ACX52577.1 potassium-transporting ATPase, C subunit [Ammonifex degensii KC4]